jgi:sensor domain CHASE-containing protein
MSIALHLDTSGLGGKLLALVLLRPASLALLVMGISYLWVYMRRTGPERERSVEGPVSA